MPRKRATGGGEVGGGGVSAYAANTTAVSTGRVAWISGGGGIGRQRRSGPQKYRQREEGKGR